MGSKKNKVKQEETSQSVDTQETEKPSKSHKRKKHNEREVIDIKEEVDIEGPVPKKKKHSEKISQKTEEDSFVAVIKKKETADTETDIDVQTNVTPKKKKKKNKSNDNSFQESNSNSEEIVSNGISSGEKVKQEIMHEVVEIDIDELKMENPELPQGADEPALHKEVIMPQNDLMELIRRIGVLLPENDCLSYKCRADKLNWDDIAFSHYSAIECKESWFHLQKSVRRYRVMNEVLEDAKSFVLNPPKTRKKMYPGMPQKPPSSYQLFYKKKKPSLLIEEPGLDIAEISKRISQMFKNLSEEKRKKYDKQASQLKAKYDEELQLFYENHPELAANIKKDKSLENKPVKPSTPFMLYFKSQLRKNGNSDGKDVHSDNTFKELCKKQWKELSMKKKMLWITKAEQDVTRYEEEMKEYVSKHPNFNNVSIKSILNKEEIALKEKYSGKPDKPPTSAYSLFSKNLLQSDEIKKINARDRMNHIATQWKNCSDEEKSKFRAKVDELMEQYKIDYEKYLESLPAEKREEEIKKNAPKKKAEGGAKKKQNNKAEKLQKVPEPATPPISAFSYFASSNNIEDKKTAKKEWKKLSDDEKGKYEKALIEIKRDYILNFEKFLNSLSKEELQDYSKLKQELKFNSEDFVDDDTTSSSSKDEEDNEEEEEDDEDE